MAAAEVCKAYAQHVVSVQTIGLSRHADMSKQVRVLSKDVQSIRLS